MFYLKACFSFKLKYLIFMLYFSFKTPVYRHFSPFSAPHFHSKPSEECVTSQSRRWPISLRMSSLSPAGGKLPEPAGGAAAPWLCSFRRMQQFCDFSSLKCYFLATLWQNSVCSSVLSVFFNSCGVRI